MFTTLLVAFGLLSLGWADCPLSPHPVNSIQPTIAPGWNWSVVSTNLSKPRSIAFDGAGRLLVLQSGKGIAALELEDNGGNCVRERSRSNVINETTVRSISLNLKLRISAHYVTV
ncbi:MAG: hypothetical protein Q9163_004208 [Psora crenata]